MHMPPSSAPGDVYHRRDATRWRLVGCYLAGVCVLGAEGGQRRASSNPNIGTGPVVRRHRVIARVRRVERGDHHRGSPTRYSTRSRRCAWRHEGIHFMWQGALHHTCTGVLLGCERMEVSEGIQARRCRGPRVFGGPGHTLRRWTGLSRWRDVLHAVRLRAADLRRARGRLVRMPGRDMHGGWRSMSVRADLHRQRQHGRPLRRRRTSGHLHGEAPLFEGQARLRNHPGRRDMRGQRLSRV